LGLNWSKTPSRSKASSNWPQLALPAPMPKVKTFTASSTAFATGAGTASISKPTAPAASMARPSSTMRIASAAV